TFPATPGQDIGPGLFPMMIGVGLAVCGGALLWTGRDQGGAAWFASAEGTRRPRLMPGAALVVGALVFYALVVETAGFFLTAFVFLVVLFLAFGVPRRWVAPIAAMVTIGLHVAFYTLLRVPLPWGWLEGIAW